MKRKDCRKVLGGGFLTKKKWNSKSIFMIVLMLGFVLAVFSGDITGAVTYTDDLCTGGTPSASSEWNVDRSAEKAFDDIHSTEASNCWLSSSTAPQWIQYELPISKIVKKYSIRASGYSSWFQGAPKSWRFEGSNNGINYDILDEVIGLGQSDWSSGEIKEFTISNSNNYGYYRIYITEDNNYANTIIISEIEMMAIVSAAVCGDGVIEGGEGCDDSNTADGDGCSSACAVEQDYSCAGEPSVCTLFGTVLLIHSDDTDGSTTFIDSSVGGGTHTTHTINSVGDAHHETDRAKFGQSSIYFDGSGDYLSTPDSADWDFGTGDFTIDMWVYPDGDQLYPSFITTFDAGHPYNGYNFGSSNTQNTLCLWGTTGGLTATEGFNYDTSLTTDTWHHIALVGDGESNYYIFVDGVKKVEHTLSGSVDCAANNSILIGKRYRTGYETYAFKGYIDELRVSKGIARTQDPNDPMYDPEGDGFTPPTAPYGAPAVCGNGLIEGGEGCDDSNTADGDGCSSACAVEQDYSCAGEPSVCSPIPVPDLQGIVKDEGGAPIANAKVLIVDQDSINQGSGTGSFYYTTSNSTGGWSYYDAVPGTYLVVGYDPVDSSRGADAKPHIVLS